MIDKVRAAAYRIPTDRPEADGTFAWTSTTLVVAYVSAGNKRGLGLTYAHASVVAIIEELLAPAITEHDCFDIGGCWIAMQRADGGTIPLTKQEINSVGTWPAPNGQALEFLKDSWGNPLGFTRAAQPEPRLNPTGGAFVVYSAGPDGKLGMDPVTLVPNPAVRDWNDNITSAQP